MTRRLGQRAACWLAAGLLAAGATPAQPLARFAFARPMMGTEVRLVLYAPDSARASEAAEAAFARLDTLNTRLSDYRAESELNRLSATAGTGRWVPVSEELWTVLAEARRLAEATGGAFDPTVGPLTRWWRWARRRNQLPPAEALAEALEAVGYRHVRLDSAKRRVRLDRPGMRLDLGGIAKGYAADEALAVLAAHGFERALVDAGGDVAVGAPPPDAAGWRLAVARPDTAGQRSQETHILTGTGIATSGDAYRYVEVDGRRYSHLLDPRTGLGLTHRREVTVVAPSAMLADALASAFSVLAVEDVLALATSWPGVAVRVLEPDAAGRLVVRASYGLGAPGGAP